MIRRRLPLLLASTILALAWAAAVPAAVTEENGPATRLDSGAPLVVGRTHTLDSRVLGQKRTVSVGLPEGYDETGSSYPVLYVLDGAANAPTVRGAAEFLAYGTAVKLK